MDLNEGDSIDAEVFMENKSELQERDRGKSNRIEMKTRAKHKLSLNEGMRHRCKSSCEERGADWLETQFGDVCRSTIGT